MFSLGFDLSSRWLWPRRCRLGETSRCIWTWVEGKKVEFLPELLAEHSFLWLVTTMHIEPESEAIGSERVPMGSH